MMLNKLQVVGFSQKAIHSETNGILVQSGNHACLRISVMLVPIFVCLPRLYYESLTFKTSNQNSRHGFLITHFTVNANNKHIGPKSK